MTQEATMHTIVDIIYLSLFYKEHTTAGGGTSSPAILLGASIGSVLVFILTANAIAFLSIAGRKHYKRRHRSQEVISDYASVIIVPVATRPDLPQRIPMHTEKNVAYGSHQSGKQSANEDEKSATKISGVRWNVDTDPDQASMIAFDDDGYPVMQRSGTLYMDVLPLQTYPKVIATASESQVTKEHCSKPRHPQDTEYNGNDGYPSLGP